MYAGERVLDLGGKRQQAVLAVLLLHANQAVSTTTLLECVWGDQPPDGGHRVIACYVHRLRKALAAATDQPEAEVIQSMPGAYQMSVGEDQLDMDTFHQLVLTGRQERTQGDWQRAVRILRQALAMWRGTPLNGVPGPFAAMQRIRMHEYRTEVLVDCLDADLAAGRHTEAMADLMDLAMSNPLHERVAEMLMIALYRCGRQTEALATFRRLRGEVKRKARVEPNVRLRRLHQAILESAEPPPRDARISAQL
ncbi:AfsR/SARP family transcriptional regulator [Nonomuraea sp. NPDC048881]|uniref:AfsR/SARP family transcriptional regulator n=1 Tax=Nonomuraea sp. NPDC048881 TaxID=3155030 RepID=UPI0033DBC1EA